MALLRLALLPIILLIELNDPRPWAQATGWILLAAALYAFLAAVLTIRSTDAPPGGWRPYALVDLIFIGLLTWQSGGATSELRAVLASLPFVVAFVGRPRSTAAFAILSGAVYIIASEAAAGTPPRAYVLGVTLLLIWAGTLAALLSMAITRGRDRALALASARQQLIDATQREAERERQRLAYRLHDDPIQSLQAAQLQHGRLERGNHLALPMAREAVSGALVQLRAIAGDLRPADIERVGLTEALHETARRLVSDRGPDAQIRLSIAVESEGANDELLFALSRELLTNAISHSGAQHVDLNLSDQADQVVLKVEDDGRGFPPDRPQQARREGHIGLASCRERVEAHGGSLELASRPGQGTTATIVLPKHDELGSDERSAAALVAAPER